MAYIRNDHLRDVLNLAVWALAALEVALSVVVLGITGAASNGFKSHLKCDTPDKLNYNIAAAVITFIILPALFLVDKCFVRPRKLIGKVSLSVWAAVNVLFLILWAAAIGSAFYTCSDLCSACGFLEPSSIRYPPKCCNCPGIAGTNGGDYGGLCDGGQDDDFVPIGWERRHYWYEATQGLDIAMMLLFLLSAAAALSLLLVGRSPRSSGNELDINMHDNITVPKVSAPSRELEVKVQPPPYSQHTAPHVDAYHN